MPSLLAAMPGGVDVGTSCTACFEATDFAAADLDAELAAARSPSSAAAATSTIGDADAVDRRACRRDRDAARARCSARSRLRDVARADRLDELDFELPLVGGDTPTGTLALDAISPRCSRRTFPPTTRSPATPSGCATRSCAGTCAATSPAASTSSSAPRRGRPARFAVVDYKTQLARRRRART